MKCLTILFENVSTKTLINHGRSRCFRAEAHSECHPVRNGKLFKYMIAILMCVIYVGQMTLCLPRQSAALEEQNENETLTKHLF